jgi:endonuclease III
MELDKPHPAPENWEITYHTIEEMRKEKTAPVDTMGCHMPMIDSTLDQKVRANPSLVSRSLTIRRHVDL